MPTTAFNLFRTAVNLRPVHCDFAGGLGFGVPLLRGGCPSSYHENDWALLVLQFQVRALADLRAPDGHVKSYLKTFFGVDADEYVREHRIRAEALLGGLIANMDCTLRFGVWIPLEAPAAMSTSSPTVAEPPVRSEAGVKLWVLTTGNTAPE